MPKNPSNKTFLHKGKKPHICLGLAILSPGKWGVSTISKHYGWDIYDLKKAILKMESKGLLTISRRKIYATSLGSLVYHETLEHMPRG